MLATAPFLLDASFKHSNVAPALLDRFGQVGGLFVKQRVKVARAVQHSSFLSQEGLLFDLSVSDVAWVQYRKRVACGLHFLCCFHNAGAPRCSAVDVRLARQKSFNGAGGGCYCTAGTIQILRILKTRWVAPCFWRIEFSQRNGGGDLLTKCIDGCFLLLEFNDLLGDHGPRETVALPCRFGHLPKGGANGSNRDKCGKKSDYGCLVTVQPKLQAAKIELVFRCGFGGGPAYRCGDIVGYGERHGAANDHCEQCDGETVIRLHAYPPARILAARSYLARAA